MKMNSRAALFSIALAAASGTATASDGLVEISQACATTTGCFSGDSPGFPVTISSSNGRSYILTSDLSASTTEESLIQISSNRITLDLGGFSVSNSISTAGAPDVIEGSAFAGYTVIRNGSIRGGGVGADFAATSGTRVEDVFFLNNGAGGVAAGDDSFIRNNRMTTSVATSGNGITVGDRSDVTGNLVDNSSSDGIHAGEGCTVSGNTVSRSGGDGIDAGQGANISGNTVRDNESTGIRVAFSGRISGNSIFSNEGDGIIASYSSLVSDNLVASNQGDGISGSDGGLVIGNSVSFNQGSGLDLISSVYRNNNIQSPIPGTSVTGGVDGGGNICNGTTTCP